MIRHQQNKQNLKNVNNQKLIVTLLNFRPSTGICFIMSSLKNNVFHTLVFTMPRRRCLLKDIVFLLLFYCFFRILFLTFDILGQGQSEISKEHFS